MERQRPVRRGSLVGPLILVVLGLVFLLNNLGLLSWSAWELIFRLWPLLLIAIGLDLLLRSRTASTGWSIAGSVLIVALVLGVAGLVALMPAQRSVLGEPGAAQLDLPWLGPEQITFAAGSTYSQQISQPLNGAQRAEVEISFGVGNMNLEAMSEPVGLIDGNLILQENERVAQDFHVSDGVAYYRLHNEATSPFQTDGPFRGDDRRWDLKLNPEVPTKLKISGGVGKADLDLSKLRVTDLQVQTGVSNTEITLPKQGQLQARIEGGVSRVTVYVPKGMAARIQVEKGLSSIDVNGDFQGLGNGYVSPNYDTATDRVDLLIQGGIGKITVQETDIS